MKAMERLARIEKGRAEGFAHGDCMTCGWASIPLRQVDDEERF